MDANARANSDKAASHLDADDASNRNAFAYSYGDACRSRSKYTGPIYGHADIHAYRPDFYAYTDAQGDHHRPQVS